MAHLQDLAQAVVLCGVLDQPLLNFEVEVFRVNLHLWRQCLGVLVPDRLVVVLQTGGLLCEVGLGVTAFLF